MPHLKSPKNQNRRPALGRPAIKLLGGFKKFAVDPFTIKKISLPESVNQQVSVLPTELPGLLLLERELFMLLSAHLANIGILRK